MLKGLLNRVIGDPNEREVRKLQPFVEAVNAIEPEMERRTNAELRGVTDRLRARLASGSSVDDLLAEAFAAAREASKRTVSMRPFDVQLIGGVVLHQGKIAEMRTGEGKTLVATLPVYLNSLAGKGVHLVTVNDYLARRDTLWMGKIYHLLGLTVGLLQQGAEQPAFLYDPAYQREPYPGLRPVPRKVAYAADVTYGTNNEFGFDYLRDNLALSLEGRVQRPLWYAIVDEVDNIFIDEARTPLIISGASGEPVEEYGRFAIIARQLEAGVHFELDEKERSVHLTDEGLLVVERETGIENLYDEANYRYVHFMQQALKAQVLFQEGRDYIRQRKQIVLVDSHTGRLMPNRRLSEGLHQAIEAKEGVPVLPRDVTSATITIQNYFRMYKKLAGMSGTALTESEEFFKIYKVDVLTIPTNRPMIRADHSDVVYRTEEAKLRAVARELLSCNSRGQPVLVGTTSVEMSERLSSRLSAERLQMAALAPRIALAIQDVEGDREERTRLTEALNINLETANAASWRKLMRDANLESNALAPVHVAWLAEYLALPDDDQVRHALERLLREGIPHQVLNAKEHTREAGIIARAGEPGTVTIATNMAGRGVDIRLGGELTDEVIEQAHRALRARGLDPFRATSAQMDSAVAEVAPQYAKRREQILATGGLHILGTERHEARRIDNQLRGRSGRQGEPGSSRFFLSLEDDLMRRFGRREMLSKLMATIGDDFPIEHSLVSKTIERAQSSVEGYNFDIRKHLLEYDDVLNRQRESIYGERVRILQSEDVRDDTLRMLGAQVDEYLDKVEQDPDRQRLVFAGLDDIMPLILPSSTAPFQGPVRFGSHLTAYPPFSIHFIADRLAGGSLDEIEAAIRELPRRAAAAYGEQMRRSVRETFENASAKYDEQLERYRALLEEKIDDYMQLAEERQETPEARRLAQHLERTYPLKLTTPRQASGSALEDLRRQWLLQIDAEFHRLTCAGLIDRTKGRLPPEAAAGLDRIRPARLESNTLEAEMQRVRELAAKQPQAGAARRVDGSAPPSQPSTDDLLAWLAALKQASDLDYGRLDRLVGHVLGAWLDDLAVEYQAAQARSASRDGEAEGGRTKVELERLRDSVVEGKKGARVDLESILRQLNDLVHLELDDLERLLELAVSHEYDKWAQRQLGDPAGDSVRAHLRDNSWQTVAEHLLAAHYTQRQVYDREHRRQLSWLPRLPMSYVVEASAQGLASEELREAVLGTLLGAIELREATWGRHELQSRKQWSLDGMDGHTYDALLRFLGAREIGEHRADTVDELPEDLANLLSFVLALREVRDLPLGALEDAQNVIAHLREVMEQGLLETPIGQLDAAIQETLIARLRQGGALEDQAARARFEEQPIRDWERRTRDLVASMLGGHRVEASQHQTVGQMDAPEREAILAYLRRQRRFVDEEHVQRFLVHQGLGDLPPATRQAALRRLARMRLDQLGRRRVSNLDTVTRQVALDSAQRQGLFTDTQRRSQILNRTLGELDPALRVGFGLALAQKVWNPDHTLEESPELCDHVLLSLRHGEAADDAARTAALPEQRLGDLEGGLGAEIRTELLDGLQAGLRTQTMEEIPETTRRVVHRLLLERGYFEDPEKAGWFERRTLAQLPPETLQGLERRLGDIRLSELASTPFRELPADVQEALIAAMDRDGILTDRAERLRVTQVGSLGDLAGRDRTRLVQQLGRQWLVQIRDRRPPNLEPRDRDIVTAYVRSQGQFTDEFKEELFSYQRIEEFGVLGPEVERALTGDLARMLDELPIGSLAPELQTQVHSHLKRAGYFVDEALLRKVPSLRPQELPLDLRRTVEGLMGDWLLTEPNALAHTPLSDLAVSPSLDSMPVGLLPAPVEALLWRFLDERGHFLDEGKRSVFLERRLSDVGSDVYEQISFDLAAHLEREIGDRPVSELETQLRQGLREAVEAQGYFESPDAESRVLSQPLDSLPRSDLDALALDLGEVQLSLWGERRLADLAAVDRERILAHLQAHDWFVDPARQEWIKGRRLSELAAGLPPGFLDALRDRQAERLGQLRWVDLDRAQKRVAFQLLDDQGLRLAESQMRPLRSSTVKDLEAYPDLLWHLGSRVTAGWEGTAIQDLEPSRRDAVGHFVGRRIMSRIERGVLLHSISRLWIDYLTDIEDLRRGIGLEAFGQRDPLLEYKRKAFELFEELAGNIRRTVIRSLFRQLPQPLPS